MSYGNWGEKHGHWTVVAGILFLVALLTVISLQISGISDDVNQDRATSQAYAEAHQKFRDECAVLTATKEIISCFNNAVESARETERNEEDIRAQQEMAKAAWAMFYSTLAIGFLSLVLTVYGIMFVRDTLRATRDGNKISEKASQAQTRAYVIPSEFEIRNFAIGQHPTFVWKFKNFGQTPAFNFKFERHVIFANKPNPPVRFGWVTAHKQGVPLAPQIPWEVEARLNDPLPDGVYHACERGECYCVFFGKYRYKDHTRILRRGIFKVEMTREDGEWVMRNCHKGNRAN